MSQEGCAMKPTQVRTRLRLKGTIFALLIAAIATQVGGASVAPGVPGEPPARQLNAAMVPVVGERELLAWVESVSRGPPVPGSWALLLAGLTGVWAIGRRRVSAIGNGSGNLYRLRRR
jgi:hypothetical protein